MKRSCIPALIVLALGLAAGLGATPARAQTRPKSFEFGIFGGTVYADTPFLFFIGGRGENGELAGTRDGQFWGGRFGYNLTPHWEVELTHDDISLRDTRFRDVKRDIIAEQAAVVYNFLTTTQRKLFPYATGGIGRQSNKITILGRASEDNEIVWMAGGGFRFFFNKVMALRIDGRFKVFNEQFNIAISPQAQGRILGLCPSTSGPCPNLQIDDRFSNFEVTIGLFGVTGGKR